ncbi:hypothetical protein OSB04_013492 [Centaurea solstitialis]|uniref:Helitron helicase-like domain-containing protein n=1 Tax=Centaurea solstitialis TaxID=347529 RepID=A0AA38TY43_9ASTR|nr:hypothetical protein OSB04_013492 [Centaurea solstitialis]
MSGDLRLLPPATSAVRRPPPPSPTMSDDLRLLPPATSGGLRLPHRRRPATCGCYLRRRPAASASFSGDVRRPAAATSSDVRRPPPPSPTMSGDLRLLLPATTYRLHSSSGELKCVVLGTIKFIKEEEGWYYLACRKCNCKAIPKSSIVDLEDMDGSDSNDVAAPLKDASSNLHEVNIALQNNVPESLSFSKTPIQTTHGHQLSPEVNFHEQLHDLHEVFIDTSEEYYISRAAISSEPGTSKNRKYKSKRFSVNDIVSLDFDGDESESYAQAVKNIFGISKGKVDSSINNGHGPYVYRLHGQNYHCIGSLLPIEGSVPKFSQLYIYDTENELSNRKKAVSSRGDHISSNKDALDYEIIKDIKELLDVCNPMVIAYRMARDRFSSTVQQDVKLKLIGRRQKDGRTYNLPTVSEVAAIIVGDMDASFDKRDIVVETQSGRLQRISELHPSYLPLQYPLIFPGGEDGWRVGIKYRGIPDTVKGARAEVTMREWFSFMIQDRPNVRSLLLYARKLFQQFLVDGYTMVESQRLNFIRTQQTKLRCDSFRNLSNAVNKGQTDASTSGKRILLPSSFTGGSRYMMQKYLDAMAICKTFGYPDLFITITCNPKWPEITRFLKDKDLNPEDRPDILCRLFKIKLDQIIVDFKKDKLFGVVQAVIYTVEFQKRGLPHAHICLFLHSSVKFPTAQDVDKVISAEIPDRKEDPELYDLVHEFMIHGPCGVDNPTCPCMIDGRCSKKFPKRFVNHTSTDADGYPVYMRRDNGHVVHKGDTTLNNGYVVPYNKVLLKRYQSHINVEWCNQSGAIKYLFKYINKGPDRCTAVVYEASWRIFSYDIHYRTPSVERLPFHLPGEQIIVFEDGDNLEDVLNRPTVSASMFTAWMERNSHDAKARELTYVEFPKYYVWKSDIRSWMPRKQGMSIGRIHHVPPSLGECYYLRMLLRLHAPNPINPLKPLTF